MDPQFPATATIEARRRWNMTGIHVQAGVRYALSAAGNWQDAKHRAGPDGYPSNNLILRWSEWLRRAPTSDWFTLMGSLDCDRTLMFPIGCGPVERVFPYDGEITCFANDVWTMYWNNKGAVILTVDLVT